MAFLNDIKTAIAAGSVQTLITVPVGAEVAISTLFFNAVGGTANITLNLERQASGTDVDLLEDYPITDDLPYHFPKPIMLQEGDVLTFSATGNNINGLIGYYQEGVATTTAGVLNPRGEYNGSAEYDRLDVVEDDGTSYIQLNNGITGSAPPSVNWMILSAKGDAGNDAVADYDTLTNKPPCARSLALVLGG